MNVSIIGCKYVKDYQVLKWQLDTLDITQITTCGNGNVDKLAARYAYENNILLISLWPEKQNGWIYLWKEYYNLIHSSDILLAYWFGESNKVLCMLKKAKKLNKEVIVVRGYHADFPLSTLQNQNALPAESSPGEFSLN